MAPDSTFYMTRHAQSEHNVDLDYSIHDAPLTALGKKQTASVAPRIPELQEQVDLIVTSPLRRTLQTTLRIWGRAVERLGLDKTVCLPELQECNDYPCDIGSSREILEQDPEFAGLDFSRLTHDWTSKSGFWAPDSGSIAHRAQVVRQFLRDRPETQIAVVGHGDILKQITCDAHGPSDYMWRNAEIRVFKFDQATVRGDECFLEFERPVEGAEGYHRTSTEADLPKEFAGKL